MAGEENLPLQDIDTGRTINAKVLSREELPDDSNEKIERTTLEIPGRKSGREKKVSMIVKRINNLTMNDEEKNMPLADVWIRKWKMLKKAGIPIVPTIRRISDTEIAMTDLTADDSGVYGKADMTDSRIKRNTDKILMEIDFGEVEKKTKEVAQKANEANILLANDDALVLVVHPDETWDVMALDIGHTERKEDFLKVVHASHAENWNEGAVGDLVNFLKVIKEDISGNPAETD